MSAPASKPRYVVLQHTGYGEAHFDLMIEAAAGAERLMTWRTPVWPLEHGAALVPLGAHRRAYLEYEGPVSGGRGQVRRVARGTCRMRINAIGLCVVQFDESLGAWLLGQTARQVASYDQP